MDCEDTELERRVLAHARILKTLIRFLADDKPEILSRLKVAFGSGHVLGAYEHDFSSTEQYGDIFIRAIEEEVAKHK